MADIAHGIRNSPQTVFNIGSVSKQFTAACILLLAQQHKLSLDDDVRKYIPELPDYGSRITIRQLLNHTSGLRDYITLLYFSGVHVEDESNSRDALGMILRQKALNFAPGREWSYCNTGYFLASMIVERVSGKPLSAFAKENIFDPLGMKHTEVVNDAKRIVPNCAEGYSSSKAGGFQLSPSGWDQSGDGGVFTTIEDLIQWDRNFYDPRVGDSRLIDQLTTPGTLNDGTQLGYALGLFVETYKGLRLVRHEGEWAGFKAEFLRCPALHFSVMCLCNLSTMNPIQLAHRIVDICLSDRLKDEQRTGLPAVDTSGQTNMSPEEASAYAGFYRNPEDETIRKTIFRGGTLMYVRVPGSESALLPLGHDRFRMLGVPANVLITFGANQGTKASKMTVVVDSGTPTVFLAYEPFIPTKTEYQEYAGRYYSAELDADYVIAASDTQLVVRIKRFDDLPLSPTVKDVFRYSDYRSFTFDRDGEHRVTGFTMSSGRARRLHFARLKDEPYLR